MLIISASTTIILVVILLILGFDVDFTRPPRRVDDEISATGRGLGTTLVLFVVVVPFAFDYWIQWRKEFFVA